MAVYEAKPTVLRWDKTIQLVLKNETRKHKLSQSQIMAQIDLESSGLNEATSPTGAIGIMQIIPDRGDSSGPNWLRARPTERPLRDPTINIAFGMFMMHDAYNRALSKGFNAAQAWDKALTEYYSGSMNNPLNWRPPGGGPSVGEYLREVKLRLKAYEKHFFFKFLERFKRLLG